MAKKLIGVDLGGTTIKFAILTENGEIQQKWSLRTNILDDGSHIVPDIINSINHHLDLYKMSRDQFIGIGMGTPGTIDREKGTVIGAYNLNWKTTQNVKEEIEQGTGMQFALDNDANVAALGERWKGAGNEGDDVAFITLGTGVGGGLISNGKLIHGVVVAVRSVDMKATLAENRQREAELQDQIAAEQERAEEIEEMEKYSETLGYTEDVAKEKLGLINEGEIIFRDESH